MSLSTKDITLEQAQAVIAAAIKKSDAIHPKMNVAVVTIRIM